MSLPLQELLDMRRAIHNPITITTIYVFGSQLQLMQMATGRTSETNFWLFFHDNFILETYSSISGKTEAVEFIPPVLGKIPVLSTNIFEK